MNQSLVTFCALGYDGYGLSCSKVHKNGSSRVDIFQLKYDLLAYLLHPINKNDESWQLKLHTIIYSNIASQPNYKMNHLLQ